jgi:hypothetical protein
MSLFVVIGLLDEGNGAHQEVDHRVNGHQEETGGDLENPETAKPFVRGRKSCMINPENDLQLSIRNSV